MSLSGEADREEDEERMMAQARLAAVRYMKENSLGILLLRPSSVHCTVGR